MCLDFKECTIGRTKAKVFPEPVGADTQTSFGLNNIIQGEQLNIAVFFWYLGKSDFVCKRVQQRTPDKSRFTRYLKNTATFNWSP